jgi:hypothetical protein
MAITMRWRCPPENWCGQASKRRAASAMHAVEQAQRLRARRPPQAAVQAQRLGHLPAHGVHRVERRHRLLEDHADAVATQGAPARLGP